MRIIRKSDYNGVSISAANVVASQIRLHPNGVIGLATGSTPIGAYQELVKQHKSGYLDFSEITTINLDEYYGIKPDNEQSYRYFMNDNLFNHVNINFEKTHVPNGIAQNPVNECKRYDKLIESFGGIDLQLLGLGHNGHIGFNEPNSEFVVSTHVVDLSQSTIDANKRFFENPDDVPKKALTMGIGAIMQAKTVLLVVSGEEKTDILKKSLFGKVTPNIQASILRLHHNLIVVTDCDI